MKMTVIAGEELSTTNEKREEQKVIRDPNLERKIISRGAWRL